MSITKFFSIKFLLVSLIISPFSSKADNQEKPPTIAEQSDQADIDEHALAIKDPAQAAAYQQAQAMIAEMAEKTITDSLEQLNMIHMMLSVLSNIINNEKIPVQPGALDFIKEASYYVQQIQHERFIEMDFSVAVSLLEVNQRIMKNMIDCLNNRKFQHSFLELMTAESKRGPVSLSPATLHKSSKANKELFEKFKSKVDDIGLSKLNKFFRRLDNTIGKFSRDHAVVDRGLLGGSIVTLGTLLYWRLYNDSFEKTFPWLHKNVFGPAPIFDIDTHGNRVYNYANFKIIGKIDATIEQHWRQSIPLITIFGLFASSRLSDEYTKNFAPWFAKKATWLFNTLKGGAYIKEALKAADVASDITFDDLVGTEEAKEAFKAVLKYLEGPEPFDRINAAPNKGWLIVGPTRSGKSRLIQALCGEIAARQKARGQTPDEFKFLPITIADINQYSISHLLDLVKKCAPCIVFIDEIDLLDLQRKGQNDRLSQFLTSMSGALDRVDPKNQVIIIGATNRPQHLDKALIQPGRFGKIISLEYPTHENRKEFFRRKLDKLSLDIQFFDLDALAHRTAGASYGALEMAVGTAVLKARLHNQGVTQQHLEAAIDECVHHILDNCRHVVPEHEKEILAAHFAAHALILSLIETDLKISMVSLQAVTPEIKERMMGIHLYQEHEMEEPKLSFGTIATYNEHETINLQTKESKLNTIRYLLAGFIGEELLVGSCGYSCHKADMEQALAIAQSITFEGIDPKSQTLSKTAKAKRFAAAEELLEMCKAEIRELLSANIDTLRTVSDTLKERKSLNSTELAEVIAAA